MVIFSPLGNGDFLWLRMVNHGMIWIYPLGYVKMAIENGNL